MMQLLTDPQAWIAFATLTALELVLGIDNIIFISILVDKLPKERRELARRIGLFMAMFMRIGLLMVLAWIVGLVAPLFTVFGHEISGRDLILILGGLFLIWKAVTEIHESLEGDEGHAASGAAGSMRSVLLQIVLLDIVFSLDSVLTAVGMANDIPVMVAAVVIAVGVMLFASGPISRFVHEHPTVKMLALSFLLLIGVTLLADGFGFHVEKGYIYAAMGFAVFVEALNLAARKRRRGKAVDLHPTFVKDEAAPGAS
jgi:predicted tellurium resistance membrane protein TerC